MSLFMQTSTGFNTTISVLCGGGTNSGACIAAADALAENNACATATDAAIICTGTCRDLYDDVIDNCNATVSA